MPKHGKHKSSSPTRRSRHKYREKHRRRSRSRSNLSRKASRDSSRASWRDPLTRRSTPQDRLLRTLSDLSSSMQRRNPPIFGEVSADIERPASRVPNADFATSSIEPDEVSVRDRQNVDEQPALEGRGGDLGMSPSFLAWLT